MLLLVLVAYFMCERIQKGKQIGNSYLGMIVIGFPCTERSGSAIASELRRELDVDD